MTENYMQDQNVRQYYDRWINSPTPLGHPSDKRNFYRFVKACVAFFDHRDTSRNVRRELLEAHLYDDLHERQNYEYLRNEILVTLDTLLDYEDTSFP